jgi:hypothetical protein
LSLSFLISTANFRPIGCISQNSKNIAIPAAEKQPATDVAIAINAIAIHNA